MPPGPSLATPMVADLGFCEGGGKGVPSPKARGSSRRGVWGGEECLPPTVRGPGLSPDFFLIFGSKWAILFVQFFVLRLKRRRHIGQCPRPLIRQIIDNISETVQDRDVVTTGH